MPAKIQWGEDKIEKLREMAKAGISQREAARRLSVSKASLSGAATRNKVHFLTGAQVNRLPPPPKNAPRPLPEGKAEERDTSYILPPGHRVTWGAITSGTLLEGSPFQRSRGL